MKIVIVKHENCVTKYVFEVPEKEYVYAGDLVLVENSRGKVLATCMCDGFNVKPDSPEFNAILEGFGAKQPLAKVIGKFYYSEFKTEKKEESSENKN